MAQWTEILHTLASSPLLALLGLLVVVALLAAPLALRAAGLTGGQVVELLKATMAFVVEAVRAFRASNADKP